MAYDETLAERIRDVLVDRNDVEEKKMFGGVAFMIRGHMTVGIVQSSLMVRMDPAEADALLEEPHVRPMDFTGKPMKGYLYVDPEGLPSRRELKRWIDRAVAFNATKKPK